MALDFYTDLDLAREAPLVGQPSEGEPYRSAFRRDYARIVHSPAFRRLQRKTQLFPGDESDFFRNRLTHSLEVAQIAKSIAIRLNYQLSEELGNDAGKLIDTDLVELAGLAHDLGHPPFGHTGEHALNERMHKCGGFEGNAQTLRILSRLEKRQTSLAAETAFGSDFTEFANENDIRCGLNLCYRSLASILKYDNPIPIVGASSKLVKGYYESEARLVEQTKKHVLGARYDDCRDDRLATIEMQIMDIADDIAYSTYDFEDAMKAGFGSPLDLLQQLNNNASLREAIAQKLFFSRFKREYKSENPADSDREAFQEISGNMDYSILQMLMSYFKQVDATFDVADRKIFASGSEEERALVIAQTAITMQKLSNQIIRNGYVRAQFVSDLIGKRIRSVSLQLNRDIPALSKVNVPAETRFEIDTLKHLTFELHIKSSRLKLIEHRGQQIVHELFDCFARDTQGDLFPDDWRGRLQAISAYRNSEQMRLRIVCDFIAGMTDAYALDVYSRLTSPSPSVLFRPI